VKENNRVKEFMNVEGKRRRGRPKYIWFDTIKNDMKVVGV
jgi:hypothetical protein